jgi:hypothetical protein
MSSKMTVVALALVALLTSAYLLMSTRRSSSATVGPAAEATGARPSASMDALTSRLERLERLEQLRLISETAAPQGKADEKAGESGPVDPPSPAPPPSDAETLERRVSSYATAFDAELRDPGVARAHEGAVTGYFEQQAPGALLAVECHSLTCRLTLTHGAGKTRDELGMLWGGGPLQNGSFDYVSADGTKTYAFVGMPGHDLPVLDGNGAVSASTGAAL